MEFEPQILDLLAYFVELFALRLSQAHDPRATKVAREIDLPGKQEATAKALESAGPPALRQFKCR